MDLIFYIPSLYLFCNFLTFVHLFQVRASQCSPLVALGGRGAGQRNSKFWSSGPPLCCSQVKTRIVENIFISVPKNVLTGGVWIVSGSLPTRPLSSGRRHFTLGGILCLEEDDFCGHTSSQVFPLSIPIEFSRSLGPERFDFHK